MSEPTFTQADVEAAVEQAVTRSIQQAASQHAAEMEALRASLGPAVAAPVPANSGGVGTKLEPTWSLYDQTLAAAGEHPLQS